MNTTQTNDPIKITEAQRAFTQRPEWILRLVPPSNPAIPQLDHPELELRRELWRVYEGRQLGKNLTYTNKILCPFCSTRSNHHIVSTNLNSSELSHGLFLQCHGNCKIERPWPLKGLTTTIRHVRSRCSKARLEGSRLYGFWPQMEAVTYTSMPIDYLTPLDVYKKALQAVESPEPAYARKIACHSESRVIGHIFERLIEPAFYWIDPVLDRAFGETDIPEDLDLSCINWFHMHGALMLSKGSLISPFGYHCRFLAFAIVPPGVHQVHNIRGAIFHYCPYLYLWWGDEDRNSFSLELALIGKWNCYEFSPGLSNRFRKFYKGTLCRFLTLVLTLASRPDYLGFTLQSEIHELKQNQSTEKPTQNNKASSARRAPWITWPKPTAASNKKTYNKTGKKMPPHKKRGWCQRYNVKHQDEPIYHWRPPMMING